MEMTIQSYFSSSLAINEEDLCSQEAWLPSLFYHGELVDFEKIKSDVVHETASWEEIKESGFISKKKVHGPCFWRWNMEQ